MQGLNTPGDTQISLIQLATYPDRNMNNIQRQCRKIENEGF